MKPVASFWLWVCLHSCIRVHTPICAASLPGPAHCGETRLTSASSLLGTEMRTPSNHTEPCLSSCRIWLATAPTIFDSTWPFCGPTAKYQHMLLSMALNANYMLSSRLLLAINGTGAKLSCYNFNWCMRCPVVVVVCNLVAVKWKLKSYSETNAVRDCAKVIWVGMGPLDNRPH